jgi:CRP-like cAMP-binding protein
MAVDLQIIEPLAFFRDLDLDEMEEFAALLNPKSVAKGDVVIRKGTPALTFYVILSGSYEVSFEGGSAIPLNRRGEVMGWSTVVAPFHYTGTVTALEDGELLYISSRDFFELIQNNNQLGEKIMKKIQTVAAQRRAASGGHVSNTEAEA